MAFFVNQDNANRIVIGGVRSLAEFTRECIVVVAERSRITIQGQELKIARFNENEIEVHGHIMAVQTEKAILRKRGRDEKI